MPVDRGGDARLTGLNRKPLFACGAAIRTCSVSAAMSENGCSACRRGSGAASTTPPRADDFAGSRSGRRPERSVRSSGVDPTIWNSSVQQIATSNPFSPNSPGAMIVETITSSSGAISTNSQGAATATGSERWRGGNGDFLSSGAPAQGGYCLFQLVEASESSSSAPPRRR